MWTFTKAPDVQLHTATNHGDDDNPVSQFLVSKTYLGGKKNGTWNINW